MLRVRLDCCRICRQAHAGRCCEGLGAPQSLKARQIGFFLNHGEACKAKLAYQPALEARFLCLFPVVKLRTSTMHGPVIASYYPFAAASCRTIRKCSCHSSASPHVECCPPHMLDAEAKCRNACSCLSL